jgi:hypothetical protein
VLAGIAVVAAAVIFYLEYLLMHWLWIQMWFGGGDHAIVAAIVFVVLLLVFIWLDFILITLGIVAGLIAAFE